MYIFLKAVLQALKTSPSDVCSYRHCGAVIPKAKKRSSETVHVSSQHSNLPDLEMIGVYIRDKTVIASVK